MTGAAVRHALVTGASSGIGRGLALALGKRGAHVVVAARRRDRLDELVREIAAAGGSGEALELDVADADATYKAVSSIDAKRPLDYVVANAGVGGITPGKKLDWTRVRAILETNLVGAAATIAGAVPGMVARGEGRVVAVASVAGFRGLPRFGAYSASKAGLSHFTAALRAECKGTGITTTLAEIGPVESTMMQSLHGHPATERALVRLRQLQLAVELDMDAVVRALVDAIEHQRRHVRMPKRNALFPILTESPRRITELLLTGVPAQDGSEVAR